MSRRSTSTPHFLSTVLLAGGLSVAAGCASEGEIVGTDCSAGACETTAAALERIDAVDVLLVIDSSGSLAEEATQLKAELPRLMNAMLHGSDGETTFPPAASVHVAVTSSDMGIGHDDIDHCEGLGDDGVFLRPGELGVTCEVNYPGYLAYDGGPAAIATVDSVSCLPLVGNDGCGFEQPLEAGLKALWPSQDDRVSFRAGAGHGNGENAGFLREDSLLVVIVVTDEDDCSARDTGLFASPLALDVDPSVEEIGFNVRCAQRHDMLHDVERYTEGLRNLRPGNDNVIFAVIGGIPTDLVSEETRADYDLTSADGASDYFAHVRSDMRLENVEVPNQPPGAESLLPSCTAADGAVAYPPTRLIETAAAFGPQGVLGSICAQDFGATVGHIIRSVGERLTDAANGAQSDGDAGAQVDAGL